jgi:membrane protease YdiL (CAAX protease family)
MTDLRTAGEKQPFGRLATFGLALLAMVVSQLPALLVVYWRNPATIADAATYSSDGVAVIWTLFISNSILVALLALLARRGGGSVANYLGLIVPRRSEVVFGIAAIVVFIVVGDVLTWLLGQDIITPFQSDLYRTASAAGQLPWMVLGIVVVAPIGEEMLFRGCLFRGWLRSPRDAWPVIVLTALLFASIHLQYNWFGMSQVFVPGLLLGWLRWSSGSTILTILLHGLVNLESTVETFLAAQG